jgi:glyoxylase-like metal-dependent hydrolase (beta-lactamase superfamily II)
MAAVPADEDTISILGTRQYDAWQRRVPPPVESIAAGLWSVPVPIPDSPLRYTLCYLIPGDTGVVVVDPGWDTDDGWAALLAGLTTAGCTVGDVVGIVTTHVHRDHHGLAGRLREASGAWIGMHPAERDTLPNRLVAGGAVDRRQALADMLRGSGAPDDELALLRDRFRRRDTIGIAELVEPDVLLSDGDLVPLPGRHVQAVWTPGHTPGHLCLREVDAKLLLTGDHVLPRITPNIGQLSHQDAPLRSFLESLAKVGHYDDHDALPAHEYRFRGLAARTRALREHHEQRCRELLDMVTALGTPTVWQVAERLPWSRPWAEVGAMRPAAVAETAAHAHYLVRQDRLAWLPESTDVPRLTSV